ncbi:MAG: TolC family protein [Candidatus Omnitrophota bacterium]
MQKKRIILLHLILIFSVIALKPTVSFSYSVQNLEDPLAQYIVDLSTEISNSIYPPVKEYIVKDSKGSLKMKVLLSPWGELRDAYINESSGNDELDSICLKAVWTNERYQPFPEDLGEEERWIDVPILFQDHQKEKEISVKASGGGMSGVEEAVDIALENHMPSSIARDEIDLSRLKLREANRALFPVASLNFLETTGTTTGETQDFTDKEYKLKFEWPLYYGWRLKYAVEQAKVNIKASKEKYDNTLQALRVEVEENFYKYLVAKFNIKLQKSLREDVARIFELAKKRFDIELSTRSEFMQVESQFIQVNYQVISAENELTLAELGLQQAINIENEKELKELIDINIDKFDFEPVYVDITIDQCLDLAFNYRPDLKEKNYMVEFNKFEERIAESKNQLKIDLTGSYGKSGGAFESETLNLGEDMYLGIKASKPLGANTLSSTYTKEETSQKHGISTRTSSVSKSVDFEILNNMQHFSEKKSSDISLKKAEQELDELKENIFKEVKEFYLNYKKSLVQLSSNILKIKYKEEELKVAKLRSELNEIPFSQLVQSYMNLTDEKSYNIEAIGSLYQTLSKLNKATGYSLFLDSENLMLANSKKVE